MISLGAPAWEALCRHAQETFPEECCGAILTSTNGDEVRRITNVQNALHAKDPQTYPRDATIAYVMESKELLAVLKEADSGRATLKAFYHSHPNHDAYFSAEDKRQAMFGDEPSYPDTVYLVISIHDREVKALRAYAWNEPMKDFVEIELRTPV
ncbi:MAG: M67 family metallopeptidase [Deltaproteobacteria bacterium]|nr:M67 family metallopeptidase [Deltaproteobacteria bacterium]